VYTLQGTSRRDYSPLVCADLKTLNFVISRCCFGGVAPLKSLYFHWTALCSSAIVFTPRSLFLLFVLLFSGLIVEDLTTAATSPCCFAEDGKEMYQNLYRTCRVIVLLIKPFVLRRSRQPSPSCLLKFPNRELKQPQRTTSRKTSV